MVIDHRQVFASALANARAPRGRFGTPSYYDPNKNCPVDSGSWEDYCDCMFEKGDGGSSDENHLCHSHWCAVFAPWAPGDCSADPRKGAAPWTEVGAAARGIRKPNAGIIYGVTSLTNLPSPEQFTPVNVFYTSYADPVMLAKMWMVLRLPAFIYLTPIMEFYGRPGVNLLTLPTLVPMAYSIGGWDYVMEKLVQPVLEAGGNIADSLVSWFMGGSVGAIAAVCRQMGKKLKRNIGTYEVGVFVEVIGENALQVFNIIQHPELLKSEDGEAWGTFGDSLLIFADRLGEGSVKDAMRVAGGALKTFKWSLAAIARGDGEEAGNQLTRHESLLGKPYKKFMADLKAQADSWKRVAENFAAGGNASLFGSGFFATAANKLAKAFSGLNPGGVFDDLVKALKSFAANATTFEKSIKDVGAQAQASGGGGWSSTPSSAPALPAGAVQSTPTPAQSQVQTLVSNANSVLLSTRPRPVDWGTVKTPAPPPPASPAKRAALGAGVGAAAGAMIAGPPGALLGAGALALVALLKR